MKILITILLNASFYLGISQQQQPSQNQVFLPTFSFTPNAEMLDVTKFTNVNQTITLNNDRFVFNVQFHSINNSDGTASPANYFGETDALNILSRLNEAFNLHNIFFKYRGLTKINNSNYLQELTDISTATAMKQQFINENKYDVNSLNIFMTSYNYDSPLFYRNFGLDNTDISLPDPLNNPQIPTSMIPRLIGHSLGLLPLYYGNSTTTIFTGVIPPCITFTSTPQFLIKPTYLTTYPNAENVTRNTSSSFYNATTSGDRVVDTQSCFQEARRNYCYIYEGGGVWNLNNFVYNSNVKDQVLEPYVCTSNESNNYMGFFTGNIGYNGLFTAGQVQRMKEYIEGNMDNIFRKKLNVFEDDTPDISVLYEPFAIGGGSGGENGVPTIAYSRTYSVNTTNTGANVWNCGPFTMRFQTGFNCEFSSSTGVVTQSIYQ